MFFDTSGISKWCFNIILASLDLFQCFNWQFFICRVFSNHIFCDFCTGNGFSMAGWNCRSLSLFCRFSNSPFSKALGLNSSKQVAIDNFLFSQTFFENFFVCLIKNFYSALTENIPVWLHFLLIYSFRGFVKIFVLSDNFCISWL